MLQQARDALYAAEDAALGAATINVTSPGASPAATLTLLQQAIAAATFPGKAPANNNYPWGALVQLGPYDYVLDAQLLFRNIWGMRFEGMGMATRLIYTGPADTLNAFLLLAHCRQMRFAHLQIVTANPIGCALQQRRDNIPPDLEVPTFNTIENVLVDCATKTGIGFATGWNGSVVANNDFGEFIHCEVNGYNDTAYKFDGSQVYTVLMHQCRAYGRAGISRYAVDTLGPSGDVSAHILVEGGFTTANSLAAYHAGRSYGSYVITKANSENDACFFDGIAANYETLEISHCRYAANVIGADRCAVRLGSGPRFMSFHNNVFGEANGSLPVYFDYQVNSSHRNQDKVSFDTNHWFSPNWPFSSDTPHQMWNNDLCINEAANDLRSMEGHEFVDHNLDDLVGGVPTTYHSYLGRGGTLEFNSGSLVCPVLMQRPPAYMDDRLKLINSSTVTQTVQLPSGTHFVDLAGNTLGTKATLPPGKLLLAEALSINQWMVSLNAGCTFN